MNPSFQMTPEMEAVLTAIGNAYTENAKKQRLEAFGSLNRLAEKNGIVLVGDSITEGFPIHEMHRGSIPIYNRGISGDTTRDVLNRLQVSVYDLEPSKVFLLIGTNDLAVEQNKLVEDIAGSVKAICESIHTNLPQTQIFLLSVYPVNTTHDSKIQRRVVTNRTNASIQHLNTLLQQVASDVEITYLNVFPHLTDQEGYLWVNYTTDGLHLCVEGYCVVLSILKEFLD